MRVIWHNYNSYMKLYEVILGYNIVIYELYIVIWYEFIILVFLLISLICVLLSLAASFLVYPYYSIKLAIYLIKWGHKIAFKPCFIS